MLLSALGLVGFDSLVAHDVGFATMIAILGVESTIVALQTAARPVILALTPLWVRNLYYS